MRIAIVSGIFPPDIGGPARYVPSIAAELVRRGHEVHVLCLSEDGSEEDREYLFPITRIRRRLFKPWRAVKTFLEILSMTRRVDLVYVNGLGFESALAGLLGGVPCVHKIVGDHAWERATNRGWYSETLERYQVDSKGLHLRLLDWIRTTPIRLSRRVVVPSQFLRGIVAGWGIPRERIEVVYNAIESNGNALASPLLPPSPGPTILTICRLVPWKGVDALIGALESFTDARLVVAGDGPSRGPLEDLATRSALADRVLFLGDVGQERVRCYLEEADLFVLNSTYEGLPHAVLEAMAAGTPVVATRVGGTPEVVTDGETGLLIDPGDPAQLRQAIRRLLEDRELVERLVRRASCEFEERFSLERMVERTEAILESVGASNGS